MARSNEYSSSEILEFIKKLTLKMWEIHAESERMFEQHSEIHTKPYNRSEVRRYLEHHMLNAIREVTQCR